MTGEKNRYKPLDTLLKLDDEQLKTPKHDQMVLWLLNLENIYNVVPGVESFLDHVTTLYESIPEKDLEHYSKTIKPPSFEIISELPVKADNGFLIGYWDLMIDMGAWFKKHYSYGSYADKKFREAYHWSTLRHINEDLFDFVWGMPTLRVYIEVKPKITSFGATLRQLRTYESYMGHGKIYLYTEDLQFKDAFESQGIKVISPPERQVNLDEVI